MPASAVSAEQGVKRARDSQETDTDVSGAMSSRL